MVRRMPECGISVYDDPTLGRGWLFDDLRVSNVAGWAVGGAVSTGSAVAVPDGTAVGIGDAVAGELEVAVGFGEVDADPALGVIGVQAANMSVIASAAKIAVAEDRVAVRVLI